MKLALRFCTAVHSFPQRNFQIPLARKNRRVYPPAQIEPESFKNFAAQWKGAQPLNSCCAFNLFSAAIFGSIHFPVFSAR
jgi:hypothetical protein